MPTRVKRDGSADATTIQAAVTLAEDGDREVIIEDDGVYTNTIESFPLTISGNDWSDFILRADATSFPTFDGEGTEAMLLDAASDTGLLLAGILMRDFNPAGSSGFIGLLDADGAEIRNCSFQDCDDILHKPKGDVASPILVTNCYFQRTGGAQGVVWTAGTEEYVEFRNCLFDNRSQAGDILILPKNAGVFVKHCTLINDDGDDDMLICRDAWNNLLICTGAGAGKGLECTDAYHNGVKHPGTELTISGTDDDNLTLVIADHAAFFQAGDWPGSGDLDAGPAPRFRPHPTSAALDAGNSASGVTDDMAGLPRGSSPDIGAWETDLVVPTVTSVKLTGRRTARITFSKAMEANAELRLATNYAVKLTASRAETIRVVSVAVISTTIVELTLVADMMDNRGYTVTVAGDGPPVTT